MGLFKPVWMKNTREAVRYVENTTNQAKLRKIALTARYSLVREAAIKRITDVKILADIAKKGRDLSICAAALKKINDQAVLEDIAAFERAKMRLEAIKKLTNQSLLERIVKNDTNPSVREAAVWAITSYEILSDVARNDKAFSVRWAAVRMFDTLKCRERSAWSTEKYEENADDVSRDLDFLRKMTYQLLNGLTGDDVITATNIMFHGLLLPIPYIRSLKSNIRATGYGGNYRKHNEFVVFFMKQDVNSLISEKFEKICSDVYNIRRSTITKIDISENTLQKLTERLILINQYDN